MQMEYVECGAASLCMILAYYGKYVPLEQVRKDCNVSRDGSRASLILTAAENYGLKADGYRYSVESCMTKVRYPAIIHWNMSHFVVLRGFGKDKAYLNDPGLGEITVSMEEFNKSFTGIVLEFEPGEEFKRDGVRPGVWKSVLKWMGQNRQGTLFGFLTALVIAMVGVFVPLFQRVFLDNILNSAQIWKRGFYIFIFCLGLTELTADTLSQVYNYRIRGVFGIRLNMDFFRHLLRLPMDFYSQRSPGELIGRLSLGSTITQTLFDKVAPVVVQMLMAVLYFLVMVRSNPVLAVIVMVLVILNIAVTNIASKYTVRFMQQRMNYPGPVNMFLSRKMVFSYVYHWMKSFMFSVPCGFWRSIPFIRGSSPAEKESKNSTILLVPIAFYSSIAEPLWESTISKKSTIQN